MNATCGCGTCLFWMIGGFEVDAKCDKTGKRSGPDDCCGEWYSGQPDFLIPARKSPAPPAKERDA